MNQSTYIPLPAARAFSLLRLLLWAVMGICTLAALETITTSTAHGANPSRREDAAAERERALRRGDQFDVMQTNLDLTREELAAMKADLEKMKNELAAARAENAALKSTLEKSEQVRLKEREVLLEEVGKMIAASSSGSKKSTRTTAKSTTSTATTASAPKTAQGDGASGTASTPAATSANPAATETPAPEKPSRPRAADDTGYSHVVQKGQTLGLIAQAFREQGVNVSVDDIVKANDLPSREIKPGQKLFIPKK